MSDNHHPPGLRATLGRLAQAGVGALRVRAELLAVEWQEERLRLTHVMLLGVGAALLGMMGLLLLTAIIIFLFPVELRLWAAGGLMLLYWLGAVGAWVKLRSLLDQQPFTETIEQTRKDAECLSRME
jgi:uncharacterized membrane protein YqjE